MSIYGDDPQKLVRFDWAMKYLLRSKENFDILEGFLSALLGDNELKILELLDSESNQIEESDKFNRVDILVQDSKGQKIIIEIQNARESHYLKRILYGVSKLIVENMQVGDSYGKVPKVISVSILYFNLGMGKDYLYKSDFGIKGMTIAGDTMLVKERKETVLGIGADGKPEVKMTYEQTDVFPSYYFIQVERYQDEFKTALDEWVYMFKNNQVKKGSSSRNIEKADEKLKEMNMTNVKRKQYHRFLSEKAIAEAQETAKQEAIEEARYEGREEGKEEGKQEGIIKMIINGAKSGIDISTLSEMSGLSEEKLIEILKNEGLL